MGGASVARLAHICPHCRRIVPANTRCSCIQPREQSEAERLKRQPWRAVYKHPSYTRNRKRRWVIAQHRCESCGTDLTGQRWECDHVVEARHFMVGGVLDTETANAVDNMRVRCLACHKLKTGAARR